MLIELMAAAALAGSAPGAECRGDAAANRQLVRDFYTLGLVERKPTETTNVTPAPST